MKIAGSLFFLSLILVQPAQAESQSFDLPAGFESQQVASVNKALAFTFDFQGNYIVAVDAGAPANKRHGPILVNQVLKVTPDGQTTSLLDRTSQVISNLSFYQGTVYVVTRGQIYKIVKGKIADVVNALPTYGDYANSNLVFANGKMYFVVGTATNSGIVGPDNAWLANYPSFHDMPCQNIELAGVNFTTDNFLMAKDPNPTKPNQAGVNTNGVSMGGFSPFNTPTSAGQTIYGASNCSGALIQADPNGSNRQVFAWGFHNPKGLSVDDQGRLWLMDSGMENRGLRPIADGRDALYEVSANTWYGWPDFEAGTRVGQQALLSKFPNTPPKPQATFDLGQYKYLALAPDKFAPDAAIVQSSDNKLQIFNLISTNASDLLTIPNGKIIQYKFGPDDKLYVLADLGSGKSALYAVTNTRVPKVSVSSAIKSKQKTNMNWLAGLSLGIFSAGAGFYVIRNHRRPMQPL